MLIAQHVLSHTLNYIITVLPVLLISVFAINILTYSGYIYRVSRITSPLMRLGHLNDTTGIVFMTAFGSPSAASGMLRTLNDRGLISKREVIISVLSNALPVFFMEARTLLPVMLSLLGKTGLAIFLILVAARSVQTVIALLIGRWILPPSGTYIDRSDVERDKLEGRELIRRSFSETAVTIKRIIRVTIPVTIITFILIEAGVFRLLASKLQFTAAIFQIPPEGLGIVAAYFGNNAAAYTVAGNLLNDGVMKPGDIIITILASKVLASIFFAVRHSTPYYVGIFGSGLGLRITVLNTVLRNSIDISTIIILKFLL